MINLPFFKGKSKSVIGIDIGSSSIKVVQASKEKGVAVLDTYGSLALGPYVGDKKVGEFVNADDKQLHTVLTILLKEIKVQASKAGITIPFRSSLISLIEVPSLSDEKIAQMIPFEARRHIPVPLEEISIDWFIVPSALLSSDDKPLFEEGVNIPKEEKRKVLLIAIHNHELVKYKKLIEKTSLVPNFFEIEIFSTLRSVIFENRYPIMIIDIGARITKFYLLEHGIVLRSYFINQGGQVITNGIASRLNVEFSDAERLKRKFGMEIEDLEARHSIALVLSEIFSEANIAIVDFENKYHKSVGKIILTGGGSTMRGILVEAEKLTKIDVEIANPFSRLKHPAFLSETLKETGPEFSVAVGAALRLLGE